MLNIFVIPNAALCVSTKRKDTCLKTSEMSCLLTEFKMPLGFHSIIKMAETRIENCTIETKIHPFGSKYWHRENTV